MVAPGPGIGLGGGGHSTTALWPSSENNDTAEPIHFTRNLDTAATTRTQ